MHLHDPIVPRPSPRKPRRKFVFTKAHPRGFHLQTVNRFAKRISSAQSLQCIRDTPLFYNDIPTIVLHALSLGPRFILQTQLKPEKVLFSAINNYTTTVNMNLDVQSNMFAQLQSRQMARMTYHNAYSQSSVGPTPPPPRAHTDEDAPPIKISLLKKTLSEWLERENLLIQPADKNLCNVLIDRNIYQDALDKLLADRNSYTPITHQQATLKMQAMYDAVYSTCHKYHAERRLYNDFVSPTWGYANIYLMPKLHKPKLGWRPIVNQRNTLFTGLYTTLSRFWTEKLHKDPESRKFVLTGTDDFLHTLEEVNRMLHNNPQWDLNNMELLSLDVTNLYGNCNLKDIMKVLTAQADASREEQMMLELTGNILFNNVIESNGSLYIQQDGLAMGINYAPALANMYLFYEYDLMFRGILYCASSNPHGPLKCMKRYLDDVFALVDTKSWNITNWVHNTLNQKKRNIQFTIEHMSASRSINFLDLTVTLNVQKRRLEYENYTKPMKSNSMMHASSAFAHKEGLVKSQFVRIMKNSSSAWVYARESRRLLRSLTLRGYTAAFIQKQIPPYQLREEYMDLAQRKMLQSQRWQELKKDKVMVKLKPHRDVDVEKHNIHAALTLSQSKTKPLFIMTRGDSLYTTIFNNRKNTRLMAVTKREKIEIKSWRALREQRRTPEAQAMLAPKKAVLKQRTLKDFWSSQ